MNVLVPVICSLCYSKMAPSFDEREILKSTACTYVFPLHHNNVMIMIMFMIVIMIVMSLVETKP